MSCIRKSQTKCWRYPIMCEETWVGVRVVEIHYFNNFQETLYGPSSFTPPSP